MSEGREYWQSQQVSPDAPSDGDVPIWDAAFQQWKPGASGGGGGDEIAGATIVSGNITMDGSQAKAYGGSTDSGQHFYAGSFHEQGGALTATDLPGDDYLYLYGGKTQIFGGPVTISGTHGLAVLRGGSIEIQSGAAIISDATGDDAYSCNAGDISLASGPASPVSGGPNSLLGARILIGGATDQVAGSIILTPGAVEDGVTGDPGSIVISDTTGNAVIQAFADNTLGFFHPPGGAGIAAAIPDAAGGVVIDAEARAALNALLAAMRSWNLVTP